MLKILWKRGKIAPEEQFLPLSTIFYYLMLDFYVKTGIRFSLRDKRLFEITEVEITRVDCTFKDHSSASITYELQPYFKWLFYFRNPSIRKLSNIAIDNRIVDSCYLEQWYLKVPSDIMDTNFDILLIFLYI